MDGSEEETQLVPPPNADAGLFPTVECMEKNGKRGLFELVGSSAHRATKGEIAHLPVIGSNNHAVDIYGNPFCALNRLDEFRAWSNASHSRDIPASVVAWKRDLRASIHDCRLESSQDSCILGGRKSPPCGEMSRDPRTWRPSQNPCSSLRSRSSVIRADSFKIARPV